MGEEQDPINENISKLDRFQETWQFLIISALLAFLLPLFAMAGFYAAEKKAPYFSSILRFTLDKYNFGTIIISTALLIVPLFLWMVANNKNSMRSLIDKSDEIKKGVDKYLKSSKIVFESGIHEFDNEHLLALQRILNKLNDNVTEIYAIDNSDPITWWSDTMTGYLAILAKWKALDTHGKRRTVGRIFVYDNNELLSPILAKTITLHSLMGFRTYIFSKKMYDRIFEQLHKKYGLIIGKKEVIIWNSSIQNKIDFELKEKNWNNVNCYQSFWNIDTERNLRSSTNVIWKNYYGEDIRSNAIDVFFEFISHENKPARSNGIGKRKMEYWEKVPHQHQLLIDELLKNVFCCKNANEVKEIEGTDNFGIEIKISNCEDCAKKCKHKSQVVENKTFDFTYGEDIKDLLVEYYHKNK